ncbi:AraC-type DNA-binding protein [Tenacibaculum sp. MAR_2009_124]|uniref:AraC family transcriptional regulator n=1 Tax=Tenacibaculum sp. MAR_2009_124 TaxID=1250059 RepID=UPI00089866D0|nr:helix-turn-helix domain-containing protein [Tenacibaculum sp. MAR_2009_124]SEB35815.1 AraC-type DNA-binding protein [Tenacibaculum sp. MAR_2009_124]
MEESKNTEVLRFKKNVENVGFEIIRLSDFYSRIDENRQEPHIINFYAILFITEGKGIHEINFERYSYKEKSFLFINKGQYHKWVDYNSTKGYIIVFTEDFLESNQLKFKDLSYSFPYNSYLYKPYLELSSLVVNSFLNLVAFLYEEYKLPESDEKNEILQCLLRTFLLKIKSKEPLNKQYSNVTQKELFIRYQKMIDHRLNQSRNVNDYCQWLSVSYKKLNESCKTFTQKTAKNFLDSILVLRAKQLLIENKKSISEIAYSLSFEEPTNFAKFFKKYTNCTPKEFREV